jgi:hypothetical protein
MVKTFGRRMIGHKHKTIMNYYENRGDALKEKMGFLQGGAYS